MVWHGISNEEVFSCVQDIPKNGSFVVFCRKPVMRFANPHVQFPRTISGGYMIISLDSNSVAAGSRYEFSLEDVQEWVNEMC